MTGKLCKVAGIKPAVLVDCSSRQVGALVVALHNGTAFNLQNAFLAAAQVFSGLHVHDTGADAPDGRAHRTENRITDRAHTDNRRSLGHAVAFRKLQADCPEEFIHVGRKGAAAGNTGSEGISQHSPDFAEDQGASQQLYGIEHKPRNHKARPLQPALVYAEAGSLVKKHPVDF